MNVSTKLLVQISANSAQFVAGLNQANKSMGVMQKTLVSLKNTLVGTFGAYAFINGITEAVNKLAEFDKAMTQVSVITGSGKTTEDFKRLEQSALKLGSTTQYTAKQVAELQLEFGRLGFSTREILQTTSATVDLATATGEGLARSAEIAGSTLRAFNLDASEMGRVTNTIANSLNYSALTLDSFADGIKYVAPVAASLNISIEETAAMLSVLADAGIKGTMAGTSLRRIFTMLTDDGKPLQDRLKALSEAGITLAQANDEVGLYAQTSLLILTEYLPKVEALNAAFIKNREAADEMARGMEDNLGTAITKVGTAYDALILSFRNSNGLLKSEMTDLATFLNLWAIDSGEAFKLFFDFSSDAFENARKRIKEYYDEIEKRGKDRDKFIDERAFFYLVNYNDYLGDISEVINNQISDKELAIQVEKRYLELRDKALKDELAQLSKVTDAQIEKNKADEEALKLLIRKAEKERDERVAAKFPGLTPMQRIIESGQYDPTLPNDPYSAMASSLAHLNDQIDKNNDKQQENIENIKEARAQYAIMADQIGDSITRVIAGEFSMADAFRVVTAEILDEIQKRVIANIIEGNSKLFALNPLLGIAAVTAGFSITKGLLKRVGNSGSTKQNSRALEVYGRFEMSGKVARALVRSGDYSNGYTG